MLTLFILFLITCYIQIGIHAGRKSLEIWEKKDSESLLSALLFPASHLRGLVGSKHLSAITEIFDALNRKDRTGYWWYRSLTAVFWGARLFWNLPGISVLGVKKILKAFRGLFTDEQRWGAWRVPKGKKQEVPLAPEEELERLRAEEENIRQKIADWHARMEVEELEDPEVTRCRAAAAAAKKQAAGGGAW